MYAYYQERRVTGKQQKGKKEINNERKKIFKKSF
jgi:hypothetical protein